MGRKKLEDGGKGSAIEGKKEGKKRKRAKKKMGSAMN